MKGTKLLALVLALIMCVSLIACNNNTSNEGNTTDAQTTEAATEAATKAPDANNNNNNNNNEENNGDNGNENESGNENNADSELLGTVIYFNDFESYAATTDHSALTTLGWNALTVEKDKVMGEANTYFDFENGRLHIDAYTPNYVDGEAVPIHAFFAIPELSHEVMSQYTKTGYVMQYDIAFVAPIISAKCMSSLVINASENNWTDCSFRPSGRGNFENVTGATSYALGATGKYSGTNSNSQGKLSTMLLGSAGATGIPFMNMSVTVRVVVDPVNGPVLYLKKSSDPNTAFVKVAETTMDNGYVGWLGAASKAITLHNYLGTNVYYDNILVYAGTGEIPENVNITYDNFDVNFGWGTPGNGTIYYYEDFSDEDTWADRMMILSEVQAKSAEICQKYGISLVKSGTNATYFWIDGGRLRISNWSGISGDTRVKDTVDGDFSFFKFDELSEATKMASLAQGKYTVQYDVLYSMDDANGDGTLDYDMATWAGNLSVILNMQGTDGVACGVSCGGYGRFDYLKAEGTEISAKMLSDSSLWKAGGAGVGTKTRESDVGTITVRIVVDPTTDTVSMYAKTSMMSTFVLVATSSASAAGYTDMANATSNAIGFCLQYGTNATLDNLIVYSGDGNPPATDNQDNYYTEN